jgi:hypothetical protein
MMDLLHVITDPMFHATYGFSPIMGYEGYVDVCSTVLESIDGLKNIVRGSVFIIPAKYGKG